MTAEQNPSGTETFSYDANSNLTKEVDFDGQERDFVFDDLNREIAENWMTGGTVVNAIATAYNADSEVTSTGDSFSDYAFARDGQGHVTSVDTSGTPGAPHVVLTSQFDTQGERTSLAATINGAADFINSYGYEQIDDDELLRDILEASRQAATPEALRQLCSSRR